MYTKAHFENIREAIVSELIEAKSSVHLAVAWFTDIKLFDTLLNLCKNGVKIEVLIVDDEINENSEIEFKLLEKAGGLILKLKPSSHNLMHNKFCIIDSNAVLSGSYNWTKKAQYNHESITVVKGNSQLALDFIEEFQNLKEISGFIPPSGPQVNWLKVLQRLEAIKSLILLEEIDLSKAQLQKLRKEESEEKEIIALIDKLRFQLEEKEIHTSISLIESFLKSKQTIQKYQDPEVQALRIELNALKIQLSAIEDEKSEVEKIIHQFQTKYNEILGPIILKILHIKSKIAAENSEEKERAEEDYKEFKNSYENSVRDTPAKLTEEEKQIIKNNFKAASKLCHPDLVEDKDKEEAAQVFIELKRAYDMNNKETVKAILDDLNRGLFRKRAEIFNEKDDLLKEVVRLRRCIRDTEKNLRELLQSNLYSTVNTAGNWTEYFVKKEEELNQYLNELAVNYG